MGTKIRTLYELIFDCRPRLLSTLSPTGNFSHREFLTDLIARLSYFKRHAKKNFRKAKEASKEYYDKRINTLILDPGYYVYHIYETIRTDSKKLIDQYDGSFKIIRRISDVNYEIKRDRHN